MNTIEQRIEGLVDHILGDYGKGRDIDKIDLLRHPDKEVITDIIEKLLRIVYPGYFREKSYRIYNAKHNLSMLIEDVMYNLNEQLLLVLQVSGTENAEEKAQEVCLKFFESIPQVRAMVQTDVQAAYDGDPAATSRDEVIFCYPGLFAITVYRLAHVLYQMGVPMLPGS
jgi:serine O-acetyltransferase